MALSKQQLASKLAKITFSLDVKVEFLEFTKGNPKIAC